MNYLFKKVFQLFLNVFFFPYEIRIFSRNYLSACNITLFTVLITSPKLQIKVFFFEYVKQKYEKIVFLFFHVNFEEIEEK